MSISTHVLDAARGRPATGVIIQLQSLEVDGTWTSLARAGTDSDGRVSEWSTVVLQRGHHRLVFDTGAWFSAEGMTGFYPEVVITFTVTTPEEHHHVPLLLSPYAYSTYRGS